MASFFLTLKCQNGKVDFIMNCLLERTRIKAKVTTSKKTLFKNKFNHNIQSNIFDQMYSIKALNFP